MKTSGSKSSRRRKPTKSRRSIPGPPVVGVGASAGGLEAFTLLLKQLPVDTGFGFVLVQHLDPQHESALSQLLARATAMPVREVTNNLRVEANHVYIIPPNTGLGIVRGVLKLQPRSQGRLAPRAIDFFFEALAKDQRERSIGVILSGTASDGTLGLEAIKAEGGLTFAQDNSAKFDSMPRSAVAAGCVDRILSPEGIAKELGRIARHPYVAAPTFTGEIPLSSRGGGRTTTGARAGRATGSASPAVAVAGPLTGPDGYKQVLLLLRNHSGVDFSLYKPATILRRIMRRIVLNRQDTLETYANFLRGNVHELEALYSDALISVTSFFRNSGAFDVLKRKVLVKLLAQADDEPVRVWVLGCSTGQEAYSIAMAFAEVADKIPHARKLQLFATDLNDANLEKARHGLYAKTVVQDVSPERLRRFFVEEKNGYRVIKAVRELVIFARQNVISDPPFSRMDLISCRNLMIYLEPSLQKKILPAFHYALKPGGFLLLGASESIGNSGSLFSSSDKKEKIFSKKAAPRQAFQLPVKKDRGDLPPSGRFLRTGLTPARTAGGASDAFRTELDAEREADRITVNHFAPPGVLINADLQILQFRGATGAYLEPPTGKANFDLLKMARDGLMLPLRATINRAKKENRSARRENIPVTRANRTANVNLEVLPLKNLKEPCFLVLFMESQNNEVHPHRADVIPVASNPEKNGRSESKKGESSRVAELENALAETRDYLQSIQEHHEGANEELQASNEEGQSANEELQSLNEELETSKEELESTNEELTTVNEEMAGRNLELNRLNSDLNNLQASTHLAILLLGRDLTIRRFSTQAEKKFNLVASDVGRAIGAVRHNLDFPELDSVVAGVIAQAREFEREVKDRDGRWYSLRVRPYLTGENQVDGAVLVLFDIDQLKRTERLIVEEHEHAESIIRTVPNPLVILTADLHLQSANEAFYRTFKISPGESKGRSFFQLDHGSWNLPQLRRLLEDIIPKNSSFNDFEVTHHFKKIGHRSLLLNARCLIKSGGKPNEILIGLQDVTERLRFQNDLRRSERRYRRLFEAAQDGILILDPITRKITDANPFIVKLLGYSRKQLIKKELWQIGLLKDEQANQKAFRELKEKGFIRYEDLPLKSKSGRHHEVEFVSNLYDEAGEKVIQCNMRDITARKRMEVSLSEAKKQLERHAERLQQLVAKRTAKLTASNKLLEDSVNFIKKGRQEYHTLLIESQGMQKKLRDLTHQIIGAQENERKAISRELHDEVVQSLVGINVELSALSGHPAVKPALLEKIVHTQRLVENTVHAVYRFARELRPAVLDDLGLIPALHAYSKNLAERNKIKIHLTAFRGIESLGSAKRTTLFRVAQEALTNVTRHAQASMARVDITQIPGAVRMEVSDNGKSFQVGKTLLAKNNKRLGLVGMRERVEMVGGNLTIESTPGKGTTVRTEIPFVPGISQA